MSSFTYRGIDATEFGIVLEAVHRPVIAARRYSSITVPGRDGSTEISADGAHEDILITCDCGYLSDSDEELRINARQIASWLSKDGELEFSTELGRYYSARVVSEIPIEEDLQIGKFSIEFACFPFAMSRPKQVTTIITENGQEVSLMVEGTAHTPCTITIKNIGNKPITNPKLTLRKEV